MNKKFELVNMKVIYGIEMWQVKALMSFKDVVVGELGGYIQKEDNLSHDGNCWVSGNARVFGDAQVSGNAWVFGNAWVSGNARVSGNAWVFGYAQVCKGEHTKQVKTFTGSKHTITVDGDYLNIGCESYTVKQWMKNFRKIGKLNAYTEEEIEEYGELIQIISKIYFKGEE